LTQPPIINPARFAPVFAVGYAQDDGELTLVSAAAPMPVTTVAAAQPSPLQGSASASTVAGPFAPAAGLPVTLILDGDWTGTVTVLRSTDGGAKLLGLTAAGEPWASFSENACEPVWEEHVPGATLFLDIALVSGALEYRLGH
jgi:hypothetical protein